MSAAPSPMLVLSAPAPASGAPPGGPPGAPPGGPPFHSVLAEQWARTATAEGQQGNRATPTLLGAGAGHGGTRPGRGLPGGEAPAAALAGVLLSTHGGPTPNARNVAGATESTAAQAADLPPLPGAPEPAPTAQEAATTSASSAPVAQALADASLAEAAHPGLDPAGPVSERTTAPTLLDAHTKAAEQGPSSVAVEPVSPATAASPASAATDPPLPLDATDAPVAAESTLARPAEPRQAEDPKPAPLAPSGGKPSPTFPKPSDSPASVAESPSTSPKPTSVVPQLESASTVATVAPVEKASAATTPLTTPPAAKAAPLFAPAGSVVQTSEVAAQPATAPTVTPFAQGVDVPAGGVDMQAMVDAIRATVAIAARQGSTQARIALQPEELGGIRIHLSQTSDGLLARLVGETAAGAQALEAGRTELHRTLSSLGLPLLRMDIGSQSQPQANPREERFAGRPGGGALMGAAQQEQELDGPEQVSGAENTSRHVELAGGGLVNVLA